MNSFSQTGTRFTSQVLTRSCNYGPKKPTSATAHMKLLRNRGSREVNQGAFESRRIVRDSSHAVRTVAVLNKLKRNFDCLTSPNALPSDDPSLDGTMGSDPPKTNQCNSWSVYGPD